MVARKIRTFSRMLFNDRGPLIAHWGIMIGEPISALFELHTTTFNLWDGGWRFICRKSTGDDLARRLPPWTEFFQAGLPEYYTHMSDEQIQEIADGIVKQNDKYNLITNNCQHFVIRLYKAIVGTGKGPEDNTAAIVEKALSPEVRPLPETSDKIANAASELNAAMVEGKLSPVEEYLNAYAFNAYTDDQAKDDKAKEDDE